MKILLSLIIITVLHSVTTWAGPSTSGGGFAVVCRNSDQKITSAELLDLFEARVQHAHQLMKSTGDLTRDYVIAAKNGYRLQGYNPPITDGEIAENVKLFFDIANWVGENEKLPNLNDAASTVEIPEGCGVEPLAIFYDFQNVVTLDREIWNAMDSLSQAALITHEVVYHAYRQFNFDPATNSIDARLFTAIVFSLNLTPANSGIPANAVRKSIFHHCVQYDETSSGCIQATSFHMFDHGVNEDGIEVLRLQFNELAGRGLHTVTTLDVPRTVRIGEVFFFEGLQATGWSAQAVMDRNYVGGAVKLVIRRGQQIITEITFFD